MIIFLIGYMGSGKSTVGYELAKLINYDFTDMDTLIEQQNNCSIVEIFENKGEEKFREIEHNTLKGLLTKNNIVISTGGGTPCFFNNLELMQNAGVTIYIKMSVDKLAERLSNARQKRPLIKDMSETDLHSFIQSNLEKREPYYLQAQYKVKAGNLNVNELATFIKKEIGLQ